MKHVNTHTGFTLIELLIAMAISGLLIGSMFMVYQSQQKSYFAQEKLAETQQTLRSTMALMIDEIRMAGFDLDQADDTDFGFTNIFPTNTVTFSRDGVNGGLPATITYTHFPATRRLTRAINASGNILLSEDIEEVRFAYAFDSNDDGILETYNAGGIEAIIWAIDSDNDNLLDTNLDTNGDGVIDEFDGPGLHGNGIIAGQGLTVTDVDDNIINDVPLENIRAVRIWVLASSNRGFESGKYTNDQTYTVGDQVISPRTDGDPRTDNLLMRVSSTSVKCRNLEF